MLLLNDEMIDYDNICKNHEHRIPIVGYIYGKAHGQLLRISGIIHVLETVIDILKEISLNKTKIDFEDIKTALVNYSVPLTICHDKVRKAIKLVRYFIQTKLILTGYNGFHGESNDLNLFPIEKKILELPGEVIFLKNLKNAIKKGN